MPNAAIATTSSVLVLVDYRQRLVPAIHRGAQIVAEATRLADAARARHRTAPARTRPQRRCDPSAPRKRDRENALRRLRARAGRRVRAVGPACGSRSPADHQLAMQRLRQAGAAIVSPERVTFECLHDCRHGSFKPVLQMFKTRIG
ncbi:MAG TPA: hypothetical protein VLI72_10235 [Methylibium sp.]|nr:hypothetical protein [Methylibium sp.]